MRIMVNMSHADEPTGVATSPVDILQRWEEFGGAWRIVQHSPLLTISLCRCDGGEEVERLVSDDPAVATWLAGRTASGQ
jgi:hypothetical protein